MHYSKALLIQLKLELHIKIIDLQRKHQNNFIEIRYIKRINFN